jgi:hypothetical protein
MMFFVPAGPVIGQVASGVSLRDECQTRFQEYVKKRNPGHFFYVEDPGSKKHSCGFSFEDAGEFDRYPSSAQVEHLAQRQRRGAQLVVTLQHSLPDLGHSG